jgi:hypothetical protein
MAPRLGEEALFAAAAAHEDATGWHRERARLDADGADGGAG